ncbi:ATP-binding protein [Nocardioides litoris]|uniref:ATP-binding protein n=1 Tax=Nocardioides litoris TaxID=1926648 RepID=UPI00147716AB|nr:ATP-binding protein [Nocardioides litoris]
MTSAQGAAVDVADTVVRRRLEELARTPGVVRACVALVEGGGRRLRFTASDRDGPVVDWCHIDAYDDVPLNEVVRRGRVVTGGWDELAARFPSFVERQSGGSAAGLAAAPLVVHGQVLGGVLVYVDASVDPADLVPGTDGLAQELRVARARAARPDGALAAVPVPEGALAVDIDVPGEPRAVGGARRTVRGRLEEWGVDDDTVDTAVLCLSELVTNAVVHTGAPAEVRAVLEDDVLTVLVRDRGNHRGTRPLDAGGLHDDPLRVHGRGLQLVAALAARWGSDLDAAGATVWFVLDGVRG